MLIILKTIIPLLLLLSINSGFAQKTNYAIGANINGSYNKIYGGIQFTVLKEDKQYTTRPSWIIQMNYGIYGIKHIKQNEPDTTGGGLFFSNAETMPYDIPPNSPTTFGYYTKEHYIKNVGWNISISKEFKINKFFFFGLGFGTTIIKDKGYLIWVNPFINDIIKSNISIDVSTVYFLSNIGYHYDINKKWFVLIYLNLYFHTPINERSKDDKQYDTSDPTLPTLGTEQDLSISINYKF